MKLSFRLAKEEDTELVISLQNQAFFDDYQRFKICPSYDRSIEQMKWIINNNPLNKLTYQWSDHKKIKFKDPCYYDFIIFDGDLPVGNIIIKQRDEKECHLASLCVVTSHRNRGIGSQALKYVEKCFRDCSVITLDTPAEKQENIYFYQKNGYQVVGEVVSKDVRCTLLEKHI